ncbi:nucleotidyltransferase domain-containing protein [Pseudomonas sp. GD03766]|uniref:anti-phage Hailong system nucleotidyltransferase HalB n=1 Tax=Pseudomonas TaxID=286 RepID=UPI00244D4E53|nr:nucleotidyltransferase domain-containing protein [Pseudomonas sp. GD03766]MDH1692594.1 nucleotidyltransferase domain-containing protein [Pseudomonas sp. GD03766]
MNFTSMALYGSCARGDNQPGSDIDVFAIHDGDSYQMLYLGNLNVSAYPLELARKKAQEGDLFMMHIVAESKVITDMTGALQRLVGCFEYKSSYSIEQKKAADLAWYLVENSRSLKDYSMLNRRLAWCVRTILIARSAELRSPVFSSAKLADFFGDPLVKVLIDKKSKSKFDFESVDFVRSFLRSNNFDFPEFGVSALDYFLRTENQVALSTLKGEVGEFY